MVLIVNMKNIASSNLDCGTDKLSLYQYHAGSIFTGTVALILNFIPGD